MSAHNTLELQSLVDLAESIAAKATFLAEWRKEAGLKSKWTNHAKMEEQLLFSQLDTDIQKARDYVVSLYPDHWGLETWGLRTTRMATHITWADKMGRAKNGVSLDISTARSITYWLGVFTGYGKLARKTSHKDAKRLKALNLPLNTSLTYAFKGLNYQNTLETGEGLTPSDAMAKLFVTRQNIHRNCRPSSETTPETAFTQGVAHAFEYDPKKASWSAAPELWARLTTHPTMLALKGKTKTERNTLWLENYGEPLDDFLAKMNTLTQALTPGQKAHFLVLPPARQGVSQVAWDSNSAILREAMNMLERNIVPTDCGAWKAYALADERGNMARDTLRAA